MLRLIALALLQAASTPAGLAPAGPPGAATATRNAAPAPTLHMQAGDCAATHIQAIGPRAPNVPTAVRYENGASQQVAAPSPGLDGAKPGDTVRLCFETTVKGCGPGEDGKVFGVRNLRTGGHWRGADADPACPASASLAADKPSPDKSAAAPSP